MSNNDEIHHEDVEKQKIDGAVEQIEKQESVPVDNKENAAEKIILQDGRKAEKRTSVDAVGNQVIEIFAEEERPLKLEERVVRESKTFVTKEIHQTLRNGVVDSEVVYELDDSVWNAINSLTAKKEDISEPKKIKSLSAKKMLEEIVENKNSKKSIVNTVLIGLIVAQAMFLLWYLL
jgi:hypothetical protein